VRILLRDPAISYIEEALVSIRRHAFSIAGTYHSRTEPEKLLIDWPAYHSMYLHFLDTPYLTEEADRYFKDFFFRCLRRMKVERKSFIELYSFGAKHRLFPSQWHAARLFVSRLLRSLRPV
jgi:hypothetical protein